MAARRNSWLLAVAAAVVITAVAWVDVLFVPLVLLGPLVSGAVVGWRRGPLLPLLAAWFLGGIGMLVTDWVVNDEDQLFHLVLGVAMAGLAALAFAVAAAVARRRDARPVAHT